MRFDGGKMDTEKTKKNSTTSFWYDIIEVCAISVVIVLLIFTFVARLSTVEGNSMNNTLQNGDRLVVSNLFYTPKTGDIVVFQQSDGYFKEPLIKRVIAVGGQTLKIDFNNWAVYVDGVKLDETYVKRELAADMNRENFYTYYVAVLDENGVLTIPEGYVFVMGDNRNASSDSRFAGVGLVSESDIMGKAVFRLFPFSKIGTVE